MKNLAVQLKLMFRRKQFIITMTVMILFAVGAFLTNCFSMFGKNIVDVKAAKYMYLGSDLSSGLFYYFYILVFPLIAALPFSDSFYEERERSTTDFCLSKMSNNSYYYSKLTAVFVSGFIITAIPLLINMMLNFIAFPLDSVVDATNFPYILSRIYGDVLETILFQGLYSVSLYLYNFVYLIITSVSCGLIAVIVFQLSFFLKSNRIFLLCSFFVVYNLATIIMSTFLKSDEFLLETYIFAAKMPSDQSLLGMIVVFALMICGAAIPIPFAKKKLEDCYD